MNGRVYDPKLGRFLQADPFVQAPKDTQSLNRYTYVNNNPLSYTDPTGYFLSKLWKKWIRPLAAIALTIWQPWGTKLWATMLTGGLAGWITTGNLKGALIGAFSAGVFKGIGSKFTSLAESGKYSAELLRAGKILAHGIAGGTMSMLNGGKFGHGFWSAGFTQAFAPAIDDIDVGNLGISAKRTIAAAVVGGTASELSGGKFANGAVTGAFSRAFNDEVHKKLALRARHQVEDYIDEFIGSNPDTQTSPS